MSAAIKFAGTKVIDLNLRVIKDKDREDNFDIKFTNGYSDDNDKLFILEFTMSLSKKEEAFNLDLVYTGFFETIDPITEDFRTSAFTRVNAPAIVYPFMRSFVNTVTVNAGMESVILPTINFQELYNRSPEKKEIESKPNKGKKATKNK